MKSIQPILKTIIVVLVRAIGTLFFLGGLVLILSAFISEPVLLYALTGIFGISVGYLLMVAKKGYLASDAPESGIEKFLGRLNRNHPDDS